MEAPKSSAPRRTHLAGALVATVAAGTGLSSAWSFVGAGLAHPPTAGQRLVAQAETQNGGFLASTGTFDSPIAGPSYGAWAGAFASVIGAAAAVGGAARGSQKPTAKRAARRTVELRAGPTALDQLRTMTTVVADTGVLEDIKKFLPQDATTNPTLVLRALSGPDAKSYFDRAISWQKSSGRKFDGADSEERLEDMCDRLAVLLGCDILEVVPGVVSTEVDARLSFNTDAMITKGRELSKLYEEQGYGKDRVLIKLATTWEATPACNQLESEGIHCNMTLVLSLAQAVACAEAGATLISPFVGRILDWYKKSQNRDYTPDEDPGVVSVKEIFAYYKKFGFDTIVMGASFRSAHEVLALSGCDKMTISPGILDEIQGLQIQVTKRLDASESMKNPIEVLEEGGLTEESFRWLMNEDPMATELLASGMRAFAVDGLKLKELVRTRLAEAH